MEEGNDALLDLSAPRAWASIDPEAGRVRGEPLPVPGRVAPGQEQDLDAGRATIVILRGNRSSARPGRRAARVHGELQVAADRA